MQSMIQASEKAACIAQHIRSEKALFSLLVEEKNAKEIKSRFVQDFKTLADVLVQEMVRHEIADQVGIGMFCFCVTV